MHFEHKRLFYYLQFGWKLGHLWAEGFIQRDFAVADCVKAIPKIAPITEIINF